MPVTQSGDNASLVVHGTINDVGRDQYNTTYNYSTTPISHREGKERSGFTTLCRKINSPQQL